jgi:hypothetical protein
MSYRLTADGVLRLRDGAFIPADESNRDWREYLAWQGTPEPIEPQAGVTPTVSIEQLIDAFTPAEQDKLIANDRVKVLLFKAQGGIPLDSPTLKAAMAMVVSRGLISQQRIDQVFANLRASALHGA